jgi:hypothetical protein
MRAVNTGIRRTIEGRMMVFAEQIAACRNVRCPPDHLGLGMA